MIQLTEMTCQQGCRGKMLSLDFGTWGHSLNGCGGPYTVGKVVDPKTLTARQRRQVQEVLARLSASKQIDRDEAEQFLD